MVVDTSAWIDFFGGEEIPALEDALAAGVVVLPPIVVAELVAGARKQREREAIADLVRDLEVHEVGTNHWIRVGDLRRRLGSNGVAVSTPDAHVAQCALDRGGLLLSSDRVFLRMRDFVDLRLMG